MELAFVVMALALLVTIFSYMWSWKIQTTRYKELEKRYEEVHNHVRAELEPEYDQKFKDRLDRMRTVISDENTKLIANNTYPPLRTIQDWIRYACVGKFEELDRQLRGDIIAISEEQVTGICGSLNKMIWGALQQYKENSNGGYSISPANCRIAYTEGNRTIIMMEQLPTTRRVLFSKETNQPKGKMPNTQRGYQQYNIAFPYIYYSMIADHGSIHSISVYFSNKSIQSNSDVIYLLPFPNVESADNFSRICMGTSFKFDGTIYQQAQRVIELFWMQCFGTHGVYTGSQTGKPELQNLATWEEASEKDPSFVLRVNWRNGHSIDDIIKRAMSRRDKTPVDKCNVDLQNVLNKFTKKLGEEIKDAAEKRLKKFKSDGLADCFDEGSQTTAKSVMQRHVSDCVSAFRTECYSNISVSEMISQIKKKH